MWVHIYIFACVCVSPSKCICESMSVCLSMLVRVIVEDAKFKTALKKRDNILNHIISNLIKRLK